MPGAGMERHKLGYAAIALDQQVGRYLQFAQLRKIRVGATVQLIAEKLLHRTGAKLARGQADIVDQQQVDNRICRAFVIVGRVAMPGICEPTPVQFHSNSH